MTNKPQPLDLKDRSQRVELGRDINLIWFWEYLKTYYSDKDLEDVKEELKKVRLEMRDFAMFCIDRFVKTHIKSACEFYLRYKDKPDLLIKENFEVAKTLVEMYLSNIFRNKKITIISVHSFEKGIGGSFRLNNSPSGFMLWKSDYNKWLFKLAFKSVFEEVTEK